MGGWVGLRNERMGGFKEWADGWVRVRGGYRFSSLLKQKIKGKHLLRHLHRRIFFLKKFML